MKDTGNLEMGNVRQAINHLTCYLRSVFYYREKGLNDLAFRSSLFKIRFYFLNKGLNFLQFYLPIRNAPSPIDNCVVIRVKGILSVVG